MSLLTAAQKKSFSTYAAQGATFIVADPFFAEALKAYTRYDRITDIYTWGVERLSQRKPNPLDLFKAYEAALRAVGIAREANLAEAWEAAQRLGRDWEELLRGVSSLEEGKSYWKNLQAHRSIQATFELFADGEAPEWLKVLPFPRKPPKAVKEFWQQFPQFLAAYTAHLQKARIAFSESALHQLTSLRDQWEGVVFLHLYSVYPVVKKTLSAAIRYGAEVWSWDLLPLERVLPAIWGEKGLATQQFEWDSYSRTARIHTYTTLLEVAEEAARAISQYMNAHPEARIAVWCEGEYAELIRFFLEQNPAISSKLSPKNPTLLEKTQVGQALYPYFSAGVQEVLAEWPPIELSIEAPEERWTFLLYDTVRQNSAPNAAESWRFLFRLLQGEALMTSTWSADTQIYLGRLPQLAGGAYDAVFIIEPSSEPLGKWMRPSFWVASLRQQFSPPHLHHQMEWRLMSLLLWGSRDIYLYRRAGMEYVTPLEEFLNHLSLFKAESDITLLPPATPAPPLLPSPAPLTPSESISSPEWLSPSRISQLLTCPRRMYWDSQLEKRPPSEAAELGIQLHSLFSRLFAQKASFLSLRRLLHLLGPRRIYYRLASRRGRFAPSTPPGNPLRWKRKYHLLRPILSYVGYPFLKTLIDLTGEASGSIPPFPPILRWRHIPRSLKLRFLLRPELPIRLPEEKLHGQIDLLVKAEGLHSNTGEVWRRTFLLDLKSSTRAKGQKVTEALTAIKEAVKELCNSEYTTPEDYREPVCQLLIYAWMLHRIGQHIDQAALVSLWWRPTDKDEEARSRLPYELYNPDEIIHLSAELTRALSKIRAYLGRAKSATDFPMTTQRRYCAHCDFALLCDRLS